MHVPLCHRKSLSAGRRNEKLNELVRVAVEVSRFCGAMGSNEHPGSGISGSGQKGTHYPLLEKSCPFTYMPMFPYDGD